MDLITQFDIGAGPGHRRETPRGRLRLLLSGDFGAGTSRGEVGPHRLIDVNARQLDDCLAALAPALAVQAPAPATLRFANLEGFHPDALWRTPLFDALRAAHRSGTGPDAARAEDSGGRAENASGAVGAAPGAAAPEDPARGAPGDGAAGNADGATNGDGEADAAALERLLGRAPASASPAAPAAGESHGTGAAGSNARRLADALVRRAMQGVPRPDATPSSATTPDARAPARDACTEAMRAVLTAPAFRAVERPWLAAQWLRRCAAPECVSVTLLDVSAAALADDLRPDRAPEETGMHAALRAWQERAPADAEGATTLLVLCDPLGGTVAELMQAATLGALMSRLGGIALIPAADALVGARRDASGAPADAPRAERVETALVGLWEELRASPVGRHLAFAWPRVLLRSPYGALTERVDAFPFEELPPDPPHDAFLWGGGAVACAINLAVATGELGAALHPQRSALVPDAPPAPCRRGPRTALQPATELLLDDDAVTDLLARGFIPLRGRRGSAELSVPHLQTIARSP